MRVFDTKSIMTPGGPMRVPVDLAFNTGHVPPPPHGFSEPYELAMVKRVQSRSNPTSDAMAEYFDERGHMGMWFDFARQYRWEAGFLRGILGTALMGTAMGAAALRGLLAKKTYDRARPYEVDPTVRTPVGAEESASYPSGHAASSAAAATVLGALWPARAREFRFWADQVAASRIYAGVHYPSDVVAGQRLGSNVGHALSDFIRN